MYQRSVDVFLGLPFNIASYALLTHMIAHVCSLKVGELVISTGDTHIYLDHQDQVREQLMRDPLELSELWLNPEVRDIDKFTMDDIQLVDYKNINVLKLYQ
jgi:thymidylate synthase